MFWVWWLVVQTLSLKLVGSEKQNSNLGCCGLWYGSKELLWSSPTWCLISGVFLFKNTKIKIKVPRWYAIPIQSHTSYKFEQPFHICNFSSHWALSNCCDPLRESLHTPMIKITYTSTHMLYFYTWKIASTSPIHPQIKLQDVPYLSLSKVIIIMYGLFKKK